LRPARRLEDEDFIGENMDVEDTPLVVSGTL
jgi:hypothetical protein